MNDHTNEPELSVDSVIESAVGWLKDAAELLAELLERRGEESKKTLAEVKEIDRSLDSGEYGKFFGILPNADGTGASLTAKSMTAANVLAVLNFLVNEMDWTTAPPNTTPQNARKEQKGI